jgi:hypothetical protein
LRGLFRDPMLLALIVYAFTVSIYTASKAQPETLNQAALAIVDEDKSPAATRIITAFNPPYFTVPRLISQSEMMTRMDAGLDTFAINIPPTFSATFWLGDRPPSYSTWMQLACRRRSREAAISSPSLATRSASSCPAIARLLPFRSIWRCARVSTQN